MRPLRRPLQLALAILTIAGPLAALGAAQAVAASPAAAVTVSSVPSAAVRPAAEQSAVRAAAAAPVRVNVGFYAMTVQGLDQTDNSYYVDFYCWCTRA